MLSFVLKKVLHQKEFNWPILYSIMFSRKFAMNEFKIFKNDRNILRKGIYFIISFLLTAKLDEAFFPGILMAQGKTKFRIPYYGNRSNFDLDMPRCNIEPIKKEINS